MSIPEKQIGHFRDENGVSHLKGVSVPEPGPNEILVKNIAAASNPKDWMYPQMTNDFTYIEGSDIAGEIIKLGEGVTDLRVGQRVAAFTKMATKQNRFGAYQQYSVSPASTVIPLPDDLGYEDASTLPLAIFTAAIGLFVELGLPELPDLPNKAAPGHNEAIVIYGASSSVGAYVVQLAKLAGCYVVAIAGSSADYVKSLGADVIIDYRKFGKNPSELGDAILNELAGHHLSLGYDAIVTEASTLAIVLAITKSTGKGKLTHILPLKDDVKNAIPSNIQATFTYVGTSHDPEKDERFITRFSRQLTAYLSAADGKRTVQPNKVKIMPNGLASVSEGLKLLEAKQVSGEKLVYRIAETPEFGDARIF